jgi:hypothetical protein
VNFRKTALLLVLVLFLTACGNQVPNTNPAAEPTATTAARTIPPTFTPAPTPTPNVAAQATAMASYITNPPPGEFLESSDDSGFRLSAQISYRQQIGSFTASAGQKFIVIHAIITDYSGHSLAVAPGEFSLLGNNGSTTQLDSHTTNLPTPFQATTLTDGMAAEGDLAFLVASPTVPAKLLWKSGTTNEQILMQFI